MSTKFYAVNRETGEKWKPVVRKGPFDTGPEHQYLVLYDSGYAAVVTEDFYTYIEPLDPKTWEVIIKDTLK